MMISPSRAELQEVDQIISSSPMLINQEVPINAAAAGALLPAATSSAGRAIHSLSMSSSTAVTPHEYGTNIETKNPFNATPIVTKATVGSLQHGCLELEIGDRFTELDQHPQDIEAWLPITESRDGNAYYAAFHMLSSGIGVQALFLPLAFTSLGWSWGIICLSLAFVWQLYTLWLLIQLHESVRPAGVTTTRHSRYLWLSMAVFGDKAGKLLTLFPTMYLSGGTCVALIMIGGGSMNMFHRLIDSEASGTSSLSVTQWYLVFTCFAVILAQLPNLNSISGVSLIGAVTAVSYCTIIWVVSVIKDRPPDVSYEPVVVVVLPVDIKSEIGRVCSILNALGIIAFAFRGHNLVLEIQGTLPSSPKHPSRLPMWKGVTLSYLIIALCLFPLAIGGYWAYGDLIPSNGGIMSALDKYHKNDASTKVILGVTTLFIILNSLTSFQIYAMPVFDNIEFRYTSNSNRPCPWWLRAGSRILFGCLAFFIAVALPFLPSLAGLIGGITLPVTFAYPCIMWIMVTKPLKHSSMWYLNWSLGILGIVLSILLVLGAIRTIVTQGIEVHFF